MSALDGGFASYGDCEQAARAVHDATGIEAPVDAFELAVALGLELEARRGRAQLREGVVRFDPSARRVRQQGRVFHEAAHYVLRLHGLADTERAVGFTAGALGLPARRFDLDLARTAWDLEQLAELHPNASSQMIAMRISDRREAVITVLDEGRMTARVASPWLAAPPPRLTSVERELVDAAVASGKPERATGLLAAYPRIDGPHKRVIVVADLAQLSFRLDQTD